MSIYIKCLRPWHNWQKGTEKPSQNGCIQTRQNDIPVKFHSIVFMYERRWHFFVSRKQLELLPGRHNFLKTNCPFLYHGVYNWKTMFLLLLHRYIWIARIIYTRTKMFKHFHFPQSFLSAGNYYKINNDAQHQVGAEKI